MRIAIIAHGLSNGGAERVAALLANSFSSKGNEVYFLAVYSKNKEYSLDGNIKYKYIDVPDKNKLSRFFKRSIIINQELEMFHPDSVVSFIINELFVSALINRFPIVYSMRNDPSHLLSNVFNKALCSFTYSRAKGIVFQTPGAMNYFSKRIKAKSVVIGNPLTPNLPYWDSLKHNNTIITACRLNKQKNIHMLIKAFSIFHSDFPDYRLDIYGEGELFEELVEYTEQLGLSNYVTFCGHSKNIHEIMAQSGIFSLTSNFEGLSNSMLEALAIGIPTVVTDCPPGGASLYIKDYYNGLLVKTDDYLMLADRFKELASNSQMCNLLSNNSVKIRDILNEDAIVNEWEKLV